MHGCLRKSATRASMLWANKPLPRMMRLQVVSPQRTKCSALSGSMASHDMFIEEIAVCKSPKRLSSILKALEASGSKTVSPSSREGLHPLLIPLVEDAKTSAVTCLLRWPQPAEYTNMTMPVVSLKRGAVSVTLIARSVDEYLHRMLAEEDEAAGPGGPRPIAAAAGADGESLFKSGDIEAAGFEGKMQVRLAVNDDEEEEEDGEGKGGVDGESLFKSGDIGAAGFGGKCRMLTSFARSHFFAVTVVSALVASEWYMRNGYFPGWARPYEFAGELLASMGRMEEARDMASVIFLGELVTKIQALGYVISLIGFSWYQKIKMTQIAASPKSAGCQPVVTVIAKSDGQQHP
eukprot:gene20266-27020_t